MVDLLGMSAASPFPGRSLAAYWKLAPGECRQASPALPSQSRRTRPRFKLSLATAADTLGSRCPWWPGHHYIRDGMGVEQLYNLTTDPFEQVNLSSPPPATTRWRSSERCFSTC